MTAGALQLFGLTDFSRALKINTAANYTMGLYPPFLASWREKHCYILKISTNLAVQSFGNMMCSTETGPQRAVPIPDTANISGRGVMLTQGRILNLCNWLKHLHMEVHSLIMV